MPQFVYWEEGRLPELPSPSLRRAGRSSWEVAGFGVSHHREFRGAVELTVSETEIKYGVTVKSWKVQIIIY